VALALPAACGSGTSAAAPPVPTPASAARDGAAASAAGSSATAAPLAGKIVAVDPGHNGAAGAHPEIIDRLVNAVSKWKPCETTGTQTVAGYTEAAFNFDVAVRLAAILRAAGATVVLTRTDNTGIGPCFDQRAAIGNRAHADAAISIHADGAPAADHGFHVLEPVDVHGPSTQILAPSRRLARDIRDAYRDGTGLPPANYIGTDGIDPRSDMGGLNLSTVPKVLLECGNMRNAGDAARLSDPAFRQRIATAIAAGLTRFLTR
jgi:N-acetylmuramoyl-L-alanine amidase